MIIPIRVNDATMPLSTELPQSISMLCALNAVTLSHANFHDDARPLVIEIKRAIKHHIHTDLTVAQVEAYEKGQSFADGLAPHIELGVRKFMEAISEAAVKTLLRDARVAITIRNAGILYKLLENFKSTMMNAKLDLTTQLMGAIAEALFPVISPNEPQDVAHTATRELVEQEYDIWLSGKIGALHDLITQEAINAGWNP